MKKICKGTVKPVIVDWATITAMDFYRVKSNHKYIFLCIRAAIYILTKMFFCLQLYSKPSLS